MSDSRLHAANRAYRGRRLAPAFAAVALSLLLAACSTAPSPAEPGPAAASGLGRAQMSVVALVVEQGGNGDSYGAGVVYDTQGHIITVHHVIEDAARILVLLPGGYTLRANVVAIDPVYDFAILRAERFLPERMRPADLARELPRPGDTVWNLGNPFGTSRFGGDASVGRGVVSALHRTYLNEDTGRLYLDGIQHDAPTNPGNSGGGIFNDRGELLGLNALITTTRETPGDSGVAFALPSPVIRRVADALLRGEVITHGWLGAHRYKQATEMYPQGYGRLRAVFGPLAQGGPAMRAGVSAGDVILKVNGADVFGLHEILSLEDSLPPGRTVKLTINRAGREFDLDVQVGQRPWPVQ
ncbi:MAG: trypsin-like peptidase domain-containing protein [Planctomycetes bacterium]|nr:trypsin-like peptidase domain-containing protein [Planctomycetota bacterium]MCW8137264.1 trypsin-like peptidase domain-containing protein [Planctomycetota bacterium]